MAQQGGEYGRQTDEYGNPVQRPGGTHDKFGTTGGHGTGHTGATEACKTDQYGTTGATGACKTDPHGTTGTYGTKGGGGLATGTTGAGGGGHRRSGSSSSEDDGQGGRRKKGVKEKIKEKLPGGGRKDEQTHSTDAAYGAGGYGYEGERPEHEKKGVTEKIKEKLPGSKR